MFLDRRSISMLLLATLSKTASCASSSPVSAAIESPFPGTPDTCSSYYVAQAGDDCIHVAQKFGITLTQFLQWNPAVSEDCLQNFWESKPYCVAVSTSAGVTGSPSSGTMASNTLATSSSTVVASTTASPASLPTSSINAPSSVTPAPSTAAISASALSTAASSDILSGTSPSCKQFYKIAAGDTCSKVASAFGISLAQFLDWNAGISPDCLHGFIAGKDCCISDTVTSTRTDLGSLTRRQTTPTATAVISTPSASGMTTESAQPLQTGLSGAPSSCSQWYTVSAGEDCNRAAAAAGISLQEFLSWNPLVPADCLTNFQAGYSYCVKNYGATSPAASSGMVVITVTKHQWMSTVTVAATADGSGNSTSTASTMVTEDVRKRGTYWDRRMRRI